MFMFIKAEFEETVSVIFIAYFFALDDVLLEKFNTALPLALSPTIKTAKRQSQP